MTPEKVYCLNPDQLSEWLVRPDCVQDSLSTYTTGDNNGQKNIDYNSGEGCPDARAYNPNGDKDYLWRSLDLDYAVCVISQMKITLIFTRIIASAMPIYGEPIRMDTSND